MAHDAHTQTQDENQKSETFFNKLTADAVAWYSIKDMNDIFQVHWKQNTA